MKSSVSSVWKTVLTLILIVPLIVAAIRIYHVNATAEKPICEIYSPNEWIPLGGSFFRSSQENTNGYSIMITGNEVVSRENYFNKYGLDASSGNEENQFNYVMEISLVIRNDDNEDGRVMIGDWALIGKNNDYIVYLDQQLLMDTDDRIDSIISSISTTPGKNIMIKLPFPMIFIDDENELHKNAPYKIAVTKYPARNYVYLDN